MTDCDFCPIEKKTEWYYEDDQIVICDTFGGTPMVVLRRHTTEPTDEEMDYIDEKVTDVFGEHERYVMMNVVTDHYHAHIRKL